MSATAIGSRRCRGLSTMIRSAICLSSSLPRTRHAKASTLIGKRLSGRAKGTGVVLLREIKRLNDLVQETVSAFTNASGGLLVLGVSKTGELRGVDHLTENQLNQVLQLDNKLIGHNCSARMAEVVGPDGRAAKLALFLARPVDRAICEEVGASRRAWVRSGRQNLRLPGNAAGSA